MTDQDKTKALAELDGFKPHFGYASDRISEECFWKDGISIEFKNLPNYITSYDAIIPLIQKSINATELRVNFLNTLRSIVGKRCPKNKVGEPIVSDFDLLFTATVIELGDALLIATGKMT